MRIASTEVSAGEIEISQNTRPQIAEQTADTQPAATLPQDTTKLSSSAEGAALVQQTLGLGSGRAERVTQLRDAVASGIYSADAATTAAAMLGEVE
jgi:anti-sigma28 factor (negative regulator of flagellin synthesis)